MAFHTRWKTAASCADVDTGDDKTTSKQTPAQRDLTRFGGPLADIVRFTNLLTYLLTTDTITVPVYYNLLLN